MNRFIKEVSKANRLETEEIVQKGNQKLLVAINDLMVKTCKIEKFVDEYLPVLPKEVEVKTSDIGRAIISATMAASEKYLNCDKNTIFRWETNKGFPIRVQPHNYGEEVFYYLDDILELMKSFRGRKGSIKKIDLNESLDVFEFFIIIIAT